MEDKWWVLYTSCNNELLFSDSCTVDDPVFLMAYKRVGDTLFWVSRILFSVLFTLIFLGIERMPLMDLIKKGGKFFLRYAFVCQEIENFI